MALLQCIFCPLLPPTSFGSPEQSHSSPLWPPGGMASPPQPPSHSVLGWCISAPTTFLSPSYRPDFRCWEVGEREGSHREKKKMSPTQEPPCTDAPVYNQRLVIALAFFVFSSPGHTHRAHCIWEPAWSSGLCKRTCVYVHCGCAQTAPGESRTRFLLNLRQRLV